jgi:hypothetical protein
VETDFVIYPIDTMLALGRANAHLCLELAEIGRKHAEQVGTIAGAATSHMLDRIAPPGTAPSPVPDDASRPWAELAACRAKTFDDIRQSVATWRADVQTVVAPTDGNLPFMAMIRSVWTPVIEMAERATSPASSETSGSTATQKPLENAS